MNRFDLFRFTLFVNVALQYDWLSHSSRR